MADYSIFALAESALTISNGAQLSGFSQGDGSHLLGQTITIDSPAWEEVFLADGGTAPNGSPDDNFADNDSDQTLDGGQTVFGRSYADGTIVEGEYTLVVEDPDGNQYRLTGFNIREPGSVNSYGTVEGLSFVGTFPPAGVPLTVVSAAEGPASTETPADTYARPPCFARGTRIRTPGGWRPVERIAPGDLVVTRDSGAQPVLWVRTAPEALDGLPRDRRPVIIRADALGPGRPTRDIMVSPQHRVLVGEAGQCTWVGAPALVPAKALVGLPGIRFAMGRRDITWCHLALARHAVIDAEGLATESLLLGPMVLNALPLAERRTLLTLLPDHAHDRALNGPPARPLFGASAARRLLTRTGRNAA